MFFTDAAMRFVSIRLASTTRIDSFDLVAAEHSLAGSISRHAVQVRVRATTYAEEQRTTDDLAKAFERQNPHQWLYVVFLESLVGRHGDTWLCLCMWDTVKNPKQRAKANTAVSRMNEGKL